MRLWLLAMVLGIAGCRQPLGFDEVVDPAFDGGGRIRIDTRTFTTTLGVAAVAHRVAADGPATVL